jgi:nucleotide-binding universal stress UspA family protein
MKPRVKATPAGTERETPKAPKNKVLVAVDFSDGSRAALHYAAQLTEAFNAAVTVLNVVEVNDGWLKIGADEFPVMDEQLRESTRLRLADFTRENGGARSWQCLTRLGKPVEEIIRTADELGVDVVVIATRGLAGLKHALIGSTAEAVVRRAPCAVWIVPGRSA